jgi:hypothetical protein
LHLRVERRYSRGESRLPLVISFCGLLLFVAGCVLLAFPQLPATTNQNQPFAAPAIPLRWTLGLLVSGLVLLLATRRA